MRPVFRSKNEIVLEALKERILHGELKPGQRLVIDELAASLGVSPIPVREALRQLEAEGLVALAPYVGATVTPVHHSLVREVFELLAALEIISGRAACATMTDADLVDLERQVVAMDAAVADPDGWSLANRRLHLFVCERAQMALVGGMMARAFDHWDRLRRCYLGDGFMRRIATAQAEHHALLRAFLSRDPDEVERVLAAHNQTSLASYMRQLQDGQATGGCV